MVINDKLKGEYYRTPITKLASRNNVLVTLNELVDYFNKLSELIDENFEKITKVRSDMKVNLMTIYERTRHFKYVLDHFKIDVDLHINERLNDAIENFQNRMTTFVTPYELNLFNHSTLADDIISNTINSNSVEDWDRSINMLVSELGVRWFGGKLSDKNIVTELNNILHITKVNTYEGHTNEDYINSNLILDIFLYTSKGITWLSLGKNGDFGYNIIVKYQSKEMLFNLKLLSETYNSREGFDINVYDFDMILNTLLSTDDIKNGNVYIKVKTNIPSNTESGKEGYFLTSSDKFNDSEMKKGISEFSRGLMFHDNKDVAYFEHENDNVFDVTQKNSDKIETDVILNAKSSSVKDFATDSGEKQYYSDISNTIEDKYVQSIYNPEQAQMMDLMDIVSGYIISNSNVESNKEYLDDVKLNKKYDEGDPINYTKGESVVDLSDPSFIGDLSLVPKNENMFGIENTFSKSKVVPSQVKYGTEIKDKIIQNPFTNNETFTDISNTQYNQEANILLTPIIDHNSLIYKVLQVTDNDVLILKSDGIYRFNSRDKLSTDNSFTVKINQNNLFNVCYDAVVNNGIIYLATDVGICKMNTQTFTIERASVTGVVGGSWCKIFETIDKRNVIAIRKDFSTNLIDGKISYGESIAMTNGNGFNVLRVVCNDKKYYTYDNPAYDNELTDVSKALDYTHKRNFQEEFKVLPNPVEDRYYFYRYGHKMFVTDNPNDTTLKFSNFKLVDAMKNYNISDAVLFENKIYFTEYEGGNYVYDLNTGTVSEVQYTINKVVNNRNTVYKSYYMSKLSNLVNDNENSVGIVDKYVKLTEDELNAGYVEGTRYFYPNIKNIHLCTIEERLAGPDPDIEYYGCIGNKMSVIGSWFIGKIESFDNIDKNGVYNADMNYGYIEYADDGTFLDYTLAVATEGFMMDHSKIHKLVQVEEELPKINCFIKVENGKLFFVPNNDRNEIRNLVYINGFYYFATNQDYIFKLDENFNIINQIKSEDCNEVVGTSNLLVIQNNNVTSEEITKTESYYDTVDGSEMINGYNPDVEYYLEKDVPDNNVSDVLRPIYEWEWEDDEGLHRFNPLTDIYYDSKGNRLSWNQLFDKLKYHSFINFNAEDYNCTYPLIIRQKRNSNYPFDENGEYQTFFEGFGIIDRSETLLTDDNMEVNDSTVNITSCSVIQLYKIEQDYDSSIFKPINLETDLTYRGTTSNYDVYTLNEGFDYYVPDTDFSKIDVYLVPNRILLPKEEIYVKENNNEEVTYTRQMVKAQVTDQDINDALNGNQEENNGDFILSVKYNPIDQETREQGIDENTDYYVAADLPDKVFYDHINPDAKTRGYDSVTFNMSEYFIGDLIPFADIPQDERDGKPLYSITDDGNNYYFLDNYREGVTVLGDISNYFTTTGTYSPVEEENFNIGLEFLKVDKEKTPIPEQGVGYYIKLDEPDPNTGIPYADAGIGGETLQAWDSEKDYYIPYKMYYHFKNDTMLGGLKTFFHKRLEDSGVRYDKCVLNGDYFKATDIYTKLTTELKNQGPREGITYYVHPVSVKSEYTKVEDKTQERDFSKTYYKIVDGTPTEMYIRLSDDEITNGPVEGTDYYITEGGIYVKKTYEQLNGSFVPDTVYYIKKIDYSNVTFERCLDDRDNINTYNADFSIFSEQTCELINWEVGRKYSEEEYQNLFLNDFHEIKMVGKDNFGNYNDLGILTGEDPEFTETLNNSYESIEEYHEVTDDHRYSETRGYSNVRYYTKDSNDEYHLADLIPDDNGDVAGLVIFEEGTTYYVKKDYIVFKIPNTFLYKCNEQWDSEIPTYQIQKYFRNSIDYYLRDDIVETDTSTYEQQLSFGSKLISDSSDTNNTTLSNNAILAKNIYTNETEENTLFMNISDKTSNTINIYKLTSTQKEPEKLFSAPTGSSFNVENIGDLKYTNGKLFVFDHGIIYDYLKNEQNTWAPISLNDTANEDDYAVMRGDNLVLVKKITQDGPNKNKYEVYYYDYTTRDLVKSTAIGIVDNKPKILFHEQRVSNVDDEDILVVIDTGGSYDKTYIFNKEFIKNEENSNNIFTSRSKFTGFKAQSSESPIDCSNDDFVLLLSKQTTDYIDLIEEHENDGMTYYDGCLVLSTENSSYFFVKDSQRQLYCTRNENGLLCVKTGFKRKDNVCIFVTCPKEDKYIDGAFYDNPTIEDTDSSENFIYFNPINDNEDKLLSDYNTHYNLDLKYVGLVNSYMDDGDTVFRSILTLQMDNAEDDTLPSKRFYYIDVSNIFSSDVEVLDCVVSKDSTEDNQYSEIEFYKNYFKYKDINENYILVTYSGIDSTNLPNGLSIIAIENTYNERYLICAKGEASTEYENKTYVFNVSDKTIEEIVNKNDELVTYPVIDYFYMKYNGDFNLGEPIESPIGYESTLVWNTAKVYSLNHEYTKPLLIVDDKYLIKNAPSFDDDRDYFTKEITYDFDENKEYYLPQIIVNFNLEKTYYTKRIRTIVESIVERARSYTSTDKTSKMYHKSLLKNNNNSLKVLMNVLTR